MSIMLCIYLYTLSGIMVWSLGFTVCYLHQCPLNNFITIRCTWDIDIREVGQGQMMILLIDLDASQP